MDELYLNRIFINQKSRKGLNSLQTPYHAHATIMRAFPEIQPCEANILYRIENANEGLKFGEDYLPIVIQSRIRPDLKILQDYFLDNILIDQERVLTNIHLIAGENYRFRLRANPIITKSDNQGRLSQSVKRKGKVKKCKIPLIGEEAQKTWLENKGKFVRNNPEGEKIPGGFTIKECMVLPESTWSVLQDKKNEISIKTVLFEGILEVINIQDFKYTLINGIGPAKAFGCGLLSLARI